MKLIKTHAGNGYTDQLEEEDHLQFFGIEECCRNIEALFLDKKTINRSMYEE